jgi:hypothetical protein
MKTVFGILFAVVLVVSLGLVTASPVLAAGTIHVPGDYPTIQRAIDAAGPGDTIMVSAGTYDAFQVIGKNNIHIIGAEGATISTTNLYTALPVVGNAWVLAAVYNSTNINIESINFDGTGVGGKPVVVGIAYVDSTGTITDLTVENVIATELGAGLAIIGHVGTSTVEIIGATVSNNGGVGQGAGIYVCGGSTLEAHCNRIVDNTNFGVLNDGGKTVDATGNWWGDKSGPWHTTNLLGRGDRVIGDVDFRPWLGAGEIVLQTVFISGIVDAKAAADAEVEVDGNATVAVAPYGYNLGGSPPTDFALLGKYFTVYVPDTTQVNELEIRLYYTDTEVSGAGIADEESLRLFWWNGNEWEPFSDTGVNTDSTGNYSGYIWARIGATTALSLRDPQENIDIDGGGESPSNPPTPPCCAATVAAASGTNTARKLGILRQFRDTVLLPNSLGAEFVPLYYGTSPAIATFISQHGVLTRLVRLGFLDPVVRILTLTHGLWSARGSSA